LQKQPDKIINGTGWQEINTEDRFIEAQFGDLTLSRFTYL